MIAYLVDDDQGIRTSLTWAFRANGVELRAFAAPEEFVRDYDPAKPSCLILDLQLEGANGLSFFAGARAKGQCLLPVIIVTGTGEVQTAVHGMKLGARDFIEKPADPFRLLDRVRAAIADDARRLADAVRDADDLSRFGSLTDRERELVPMICSGMSNKQIAVQLELSVRTVHNHRAHILSKVDALNTADLVRLAMQSRSGVDANAALAA